MHCRESRLKLLVCDQVGSGWFVRVFDQTDQRTIYRKDRSRTDRSAAGF